MNMWDEKTASRICRMWVGRHGLCKIKIEEVLCFGRMPNKSLLSSKLLNKTKKIGKPKRLSVTTIINKMENDRRNGILFAF
jgi:hypothetical protein